jgi:hypothetical protein
MQGSREGWHVIGHRLEQYPFPIAYPARLLSIADSPSDRLEKTGHLIELTAPISRRATHTPTVASLGCG